MQWAALRSSCNNNTQKKKEKGGGGSLAPDLPSQSTKINTEINKYKFKNGHIFRTTVTKSGEIVV